MLTRRLLSSAIPPLSPSSDEQRSEPGGEIPGWAGAMKHQREKKSSDETSKRRVQMLPEKRASYREGAHKQHVSQWKYTWQNNKARTHTRSDQWGFTLKTKLLQMHANTANRRILTQKHKTRWENLKERWETSVSP